MLVSLNMFEGFDIADVCKDENLNSDGEFEFEMTMGKDNATQNVLGL